MLGGMGMTSKHLKKYNIIPAYKKLEHSPFKLCSVNSGQKEYINNLKNVVNETKAQSQPVVLHSMSATSWYAMDYLASNPDHQIKNLILESTPYLFDYSKLIQHLVGRKTSPAINKFVEPFLNKALTFYGADSAWKDRYIEQLENPHNVENILLIGSKNDSLIPYEHFEQLAEKLVQNGKNVDFVVSETA
eukprot:Pgem_evm1s199